MSRLTARRQHHRCRQFVVMLGQTRGRGASAGTGGQRSGAAAPESTTVVAGPDYGAERPAPLAVRQALPDALDHPDTGGGARPRHLCRRPEPAEAGRRSPDPGASVRRRRREGSTPSARSTRMPPSSCLPTSGRRSPPRLRRTRSVRRTRLVPPWRPRSPRAAGVLHSDPKLVYLPDDPRLGEFRTEFAGVLGFIEERPDENEDPSRAFAGALEIVSTDDLYKIIEKKPGNYVDSEQFLRARLLDVFMGDWDRHRDQWRWAKVKDGDRFLWVPIPRDRDQAFVLFDGLLPGFARQTFPQLLKFGPKYGAPVGATWNGRDLDRRFLTPLSRPTWDSTGRGPRRAC